MAEEETLKRGRIYGCPTCDWAGERFYATDHFARKQCTAAEAPFHCTLCKYNAGNEAKLEFHRGMEQHKQQQKMKRNI